MSLREIYLLGLLLHEKGVVTSNVLMYNHGRNEGPSYTGSISPWHGEERGSIPLGSTLESDKYYKSDKSDK